MRFTRLRSGNNAPITEPIVVHQKLRFLDEDLGRLTSLYSIQWEKLGEFEKFLQYSPLALDTFAPNERCVMLVRLSRDGNEIGRDNRHPYSNLLRDYEYYYGRTIGIIIRNGENLYLGWTDEDRVHIQDDLIVSQVIDVTPQDEPVFRSTWDREKWEKGQKEERKRILDGLISRSFVYNILQGIVDHSTMLPLPSGVTLGKPSEYVVYSIADKWLTDNRFGSFNDLVEICNKKVIKGDILLSVQHLIPERPYWNPAQSYNPAWHNARGRGDKNRTHDCSIKDNTLYPANLVEFDEPIAYVRYRYKVSSDVGKSTWCTAVTEASSARNFSADCEILEHFDSRARHIYVSVQKGNRYSYRDYETDVRANFELHDGEYINLAYMNSVWLTWVINTKSLGGWTINGHVVNYAYAIRYLNTALDFVRQREVEEKAFIDAIDPSICMDIEWPLMLSKWKLSSGVRKITLHQAKRFVRAYQSGSIV